MTGQEIKDLFENIIEDSLDEDTFLALVNNVKEIIENERDWEMLKVLDNSKTATTSAIDLPTSPAYSRTLGIFVGSTPYHQIPFEQSKMLEQSAQRWYLDLRNSQYYLLGNLTSGTVNHFYIWATPDLTLATSPVWPRFHRVLAFAAAELFFAVDQTENARAMDAKWARQYLILKRTMVDWDVALQRRSAENAMPIDYEPEIDIGRL